MRINVEISDDVWERVGLLSVVLKKSRAKVVEEALRQYLREHENEIRRYIETAMV